MNELEMLALISFQERLLSFCPFTHYLHIFFWESGESDAESEDIRKVIQLCILHEE